MSILFPRDPANIQIMDIDKFLSNIYAQPVTSHAIRDNSGKFHPDGIFSETIFGEIGRSERLTRMGYIQLSENLPVLHPEIYYILISLKKLYEGILSGKQLAVFNPEIKDFELASKATSAEADTGYQFFIEHLNDLDFQQTSSDKRKVSISILNKYKDRLLITKVPVLSAAIRDLKETEMILPKNDINTLYLGLLSLAQAAPEKILEYKLYDQLRFNTQLKIQAIYDYLINLLEGKRGLLQDKFGSRHIALSARNVITSPSLSTLSPTDPKYLHSDETAIPLIEGLKTSQPLIINKIKTFFMDSIFFTNSYQIPVIDPDTYNLVYITIDDSIKDTFTLSEQLEGTINTFIQSPELRFAPIEVRSLEAEDKKKYYLYLVYEDGNQLYIFRHLDKIKDRLNSKFDINKIRPLTYVEMFYIATYNVTKKAHTFITRYPVINFGGIYPTKIKTTTTSPDRTVTLILIKSGEDTLEDASITLPHYPILGASLVDCIQLHSSKLQLLDGDKPFLLDIANN